MGFGVQDITEAKAGEIVAMFGVDCATGEEGPHNKTLKKRQSIVENTTTRRGKTNGYEIWYDQNQEK